MIYDQQAINIKYRGYSNINQKVSNECKKNNLVRIKKGLYSDDVAKDKQVIANICCNPSYISFEYALSYYGLIPEYVSVLTSALFNKKNNKKYVCDEAIFEYKSIPDEAFPYGINFLVDDNGIRYKIASKEKALLDTLYIMYQVRSIKDLKVLLFEDLRIDEDEFNKLDFEFIKSMKDKYHSNTINTLVKYIGGLV